MWQPVLDPLTSSLKRLTRPDIGELPYSDDLVERGAKSTQSSAGLYTSGIDQRRIQSDRLLGS
jgi:hypothetical protein